MKTFGKYVTYKVDILVRLSKEEFASDLDIEDILERGQVTDYEPDHEEPDYGDEDEDTPFF